MSEQTIDQITDSIMSAVCTDAGLNREVIKGIVSERFKLNKVCPFEQSKNGRGLKFNICRDKKHEWRWTLFAANGRKIADSAEGYKRRGQVKRMIERIAAGPHVIEEV